MLIRSCSRSGSTRSPHSSPRTTNYSKGKVVVDPTNPLKLDANGTLQLGRLQRSRLPLSPYDVSSAMSSCSGSHCSSPSATRSRGVGWRSPLSATPRFYAEAMLDRVLSELAHYPRRLLLVIDDVHELVSDAACKIAASSSIPCSWNTHP